MVGDDPRGWILILMLCGFSIAFVYVIITRMCGGEKVELK